MHIAWNTPINLPSISPAGWDARIAFNGSGSYVITPSGAYNAVSCSLSYDLDYWTMIAGVSGYIRPNVVWSGVNFVSLYRSSSYSRQIQYSAHGTSWVIKSLNPYVNGYSSLVVLGGNLYAYNQSNKTISKSTTHGVSWTQAAVVSTAGSSATLYAAGEYLFITWSGGTLRSVDGITWIDCPGFWNNSSIVCNSLGVYMTGPTADVVKTTLDFITVTEVFLPGSHYYSIFSASAIGNTLIISGLGCVVVSQDGVQWSVIEDTFTPESWGGVFHYYNDQLIQFLDNQTRIRIATSFDFGGEIPMFWTNFISQYETP